MLLQIKWILLADYFKSKFTVFPGKRFYLNYLKIICYISTKALKKPKHLLVYTLTIYLFEIFRKDLLGEHLGGSVS